MAMATGNISPEMQLSLTDLAMELKTLGLKSAFTSCNTTSELSECLLSTSWALINLVHCSALGLSESNNASDREALLLSENQSLETKLGHLRSEIDAKEKLLTKERGNTLKAEMEQKKLKDCLQKQKGQVAELSFKLETQERNFRHENRKQEAQCEALKELVRKSIGVGAHQNQHPVFVERLSTGLGALRTSERSNDPALEQAAANRLKSVNCTLVAENLMLRDALKSVHTDVSVILNISQASQPAGTTKMQEQFPDHIFQLPLDYSKKKMTSMRQDQINKLYQLIQNAPCLNCN